MPENDNEKRQQVPEQCLSLNVIGKRCQGLIGHGGMHQAEQDAVRYVWSDENSPASAIDLIIGSPRPPSGGGG